MGLRPGNFPFWQVSRCAAPGVAAGHAALLSRWVETVVLRDYFRLIHRIADKRARRRVLDILGPQEPAPPHGQDPAEPHTGRAQEVT
jgi:hypothetical protein